MMDKLGKITKLHAYTITKSFIFILKQTIVQNR